MPIPMQTQSILQSGIPYFPGIHGGYGQRLHI
jgi:hypothetical protein